MKNNLFYLIRKLGKLANLPERRKRIRYLTKKQLQSLILVIERLKEEAGGRDEKKD